MTNPDIQQLLINKIKLQLEDDEKLVDALVDQLNISQDAAYRRISGKVALTIFETKILLDKYNISIGNLATYKENKILFNYQPLSRIDLNFKSYLSGLRDNLNEIKRLGDPRFTISINETPVFQLFNLPHLTRFKFFFWAKSYLRIPEYKDAKFKREKIDREALQLGIEAHNLYNTFPSTELYCPDTLRGILRQIEYYFEAGVFEDSVYALELLDNVSELSAHIKRQAELGHKFVYGNEPNTSENSTFNMYLNDTYLPDNTYHITHNDGALTYFSHNVMNFIMTQNPDYCSDTKLILDRLIDNSALISQTGAKDRDKFFVSLDRAIDNLKRKIKLELEIEE